MTIATRPPNPYGPIDEGWEEVARVDPDFELGAAGKRCRYGWREKRCPNEAVVTLYRPVGGPGRHPWRYCADHMFGRWIEDGQVMEWHVRRARP